MSQVTIENGKQRINRTPSLTGAVQGGLPNIHRNELKILQSYNGGASGKQSLHTVVTDPKSVTLKSHLHKQLIVKQAMHGGKNTAAGIPTTFISNVAVRNQQSTLHTKRPPENDDDMRNKRRKGSPGSSSSPYHNRQGEVFEHVARHRAPPSGSSPPRDAGGWERVRPFNRFVSSHNLVFSKPEAIISNSKRSRMGSS